MAKNTDVQYRNLGMIISWAARANVSVEDLEKTKNKIKAFIVWPANELADYVGDTLGLSADNKQKLLELLVQYTTFGPLAFVNQAIETSELIEVFRAPAKYDPASRKDIYDEEGGKMYRDFVDAVNISAAQFGEGERRFR